MPNYTAGSTRVALVYPDLSAGQGNGSVVLDSSRTESLWFDSRFLNARDLQREQNYFLQREADLGQAGGFQSISGLMVDQTDSDNNFVGTGSFVLHAGEGVTPAGEVVSVAEDMTISLASLAEQSSLDVRLGVSIAPSAPASKRTGLYVIGLQPMEHTAKPVAAYPTTIQGPRTTHDGEIVEETVVTLTPYPNPAGNYPASQAQAALARQIFVTGSPGVLPDSLLPLAVISVQQGAILWIDPYLVRRDSGLLYSGVRFGLSDPIAQQAYLLQYDMQLQSILSQRQASGLKANFAAADFLQSIPSGGRFPMDAIDTSDFSQVFFPQAMDVRMSIVPSDELSALLQDSLSLPPIDLTLPASAYANMALLALIPVERTQFAALKSTLTETPLNPTLPQVLANRTPRELLRLFKGGMGLTPLTAVANNAWAAAIGKQQYGFYLRRSSDPTRVRFTAPTGVSLSSSANPSVFGQPVTFSAGLSPATATGSAQFLDGTEVLGSSAISGGAASLPITNLTVGLHQIQAVYSGDAADAAGSSSVLTQVVGKAAGTVTVGSSVNPSAPGQAVVFTATVTPAVATGTVHFLDGGTVLGDGNVSDGSATLSTSVLTLGTHAITAVYSGDGNNAAATSAVFTQTVNKAGTSVALAASVNPSMFGQAVRFTAKVTPASAAGTVQFLDGATPLGTAAIDGGAATVAISTLTAGTHSITAAYGGDANNAPSTSGTLVQTVKVAASSVAVGSSLNPATVSQPVTFTAEVTPATATGTVNFLDGTTLLGTATVIQGSASLTVTGLAAGTHSITASYSGDPSDAPGTSPASTQTISKTGAGITLSSSVNPATPGQPVVFTASVLPLTATGTVEFLDGPSILGTAALSGGTASITATALTAGVHLITAAYSGDANTVAADTLPLSQTVAKTATSVTLGTSANPSSAGQQVTFTAKVTPATATGAVQFEDGTAVIGSGQLSNGTAAFATAALAVGTHNITAVYAGDASNANNTSPAVAQAVNKAATSIALAASINPSTVGQTVTFIARVTPVTATGSVQFQDGGAAIGTAAISNGAATFSDAALQAGTHTVIAVYQGDGNNGGSTSAAVVQTVNKVAPKMSVVSTPNPSFVTGALVLTATITPVTAAGNVTFTADNGKTALGAAALKGGVATLQVAGETAAGLPVLPLGSHIIVATYSGDAANSTTTTSVTQVVQQLVIQ